MKHDLGRAKSAVLLTLEILPLADIDDVVAMSSSLTVSEASVAISELVADGTIERDPDERALFRRKPRR